MRPGSVADGIRGAFPARWRFLIWATATTGSLPAHALQRASKSDIHAAVLSFGGLWEPAERAMTSWAEAQRTTIMEVFIVTASVLVLWMLLDPTVKNFLSNRRVKNAWRTMSSGHYSEMASLSVPVQGLILERFGDEFLREVQRSESSRDALLPLIVNLLGAYRPETRFAAEDFLRDAGPSSVPLLLDVLRDFHPGTGPDYYWEDAYQALKDIHFPDPVPAGRRWTQDSHLNRGNRMYGALSLLGEMEQRSALPEIVSMFGLKIAGNATPPAVLVALGQIAEPDSRFFLEAVLGAPNLGDFPTFAAEALAQFRESSDLEAILELFVNPLEEDPFDMLFRRWLSVEQERLLRALAAFGRCAASPLKTLLLREDLPRLVRAGAGEALSWMADFNSMPALLEAVAKKSGTPRLAEAVRSLAFRRTLQIALETGRSLADIGREIGLPSDSSFLVDRMENVRTSKGSGNRFWIAWRPFPPLTAHGRTPIWKPPGPWMPCVSCCWRHPNGWKNFMVPV